MDIITLLNAAYKLVIGAIKVLEAIAIALSHLVSAQYA